MKPEKGAALTQTRRPMTPLFRFWRVALWPLVPLAVWWAGRTERSALAAGRPLTAAESELARRLGVADPASVRVVAAPGLPLPGPRWVHRLASRLGFPAAESVGLCLGHGIFVHSQWAAHREVIAHELVHTAQSERLGGLRPFLHRYLAECLAHGYAEAPLEREARAASAAA